jgi:hypothetical protein
VVQNVPRWLRLILGASLLLLTLQGCLLYYFFAPKSSPEDLPEVGAALQPYRAAYIQQCGRCHVLIAPSYFRTNATIESVLDRYKRKKIINAKESEQVLTYIRALTSY